MTRQDLKDSVLWDHKYIESPVDRISIRFSKWQSGSGDPDYGILLINGRGEWAEKYSDLPPKLSKSSNILWLNIDHRGQGHSGGSRSHVQTYEEFAHDLGYVTTQVFQDLPYYVVAHSMGGLIALVACIKNHIRPQAMVLCSPLLKLPSSSFHPSLVKLIASTLQKTPMSSFPTGAGKKKNRAFPGNTITHSYQGFTKYLNSPFSRQSPSFGWVAATIQACEMVFDPQNMKQLACPIRIIYGSHEYIVDPSVYALWCSTAAKNTNSKIDLIKIQGARHELLNEIPRFELQILTLITSWLSKHRNTSKMPVS